MELIWNMIKQQILIIGHKKGGNVTVYRMLENFIKYQIKITKFGIIVLGDGTFEILFNRRIC